MTEKDRKEIQAMIKHEMLSKEEIRTEIIQPLLRVTHADHDADMKVINMKLDAIIVQTTKTNGGLSDANKKIEELEKKEIAHIIDCPQTERVRALEDNQLSQKSIKKWIAGSVGVATGVVGAFWILFQIISG